MDRIPQKGEFYLHFKNKIYQIIELARHSETGEELVIYQAMYGDFKVYARPLSMFVSEVDHEKYPQVAQHYRFTRIYMKEDGTFTYAGNAWQTGQQDLPEPPCQQDLPEQSDPPHQPDILEQSDLFRFLDAETYEEKYNILLDMKDRISDKLIDDMALSLDVVIPEGNLSTRYYELTMAVSTKQKYESSNRIG